MMNKKRVMIIKYFIDEVSGCDCFVRNIRSLIERRPDCINNSGGCMDQCYFLFLVRVMEWMQENGRYSLMLQYSHVDSSYSVQIMNAVNSPLLVSARNKVRCFSTADEARENAILWYIDSEGDEKQNIYFLKTLDVYKYLLYIIDRSND